MVKIVINVANGTCCRAVGSENLYGMFRKKVEELKACDNITVREMGCFGFSEQDPQVIVTPGDIYYCKVKPGDVTRILSASLKGECVDELLYRDSVTGDVSRELSAVPFFCKQKRILTGYYTGFEPCDVGQYMDSGGYGGLKKALKMEPAAIIEEIRKSGLRGRGGGGFPTGRKWESARNSSVDTPVKYIICNGDEGDPGAFMDRSLMEGNPFAVIEGMTIGARAVCGGSGARAQGYVYVRAEYPLAVKHLEQAIKTAREKNLLGSNIMGSGFDFDIKIIKGAGAFVCGESSALRASIEGKIGEPAVKYVHAADRGLYDSPTVLNNVKTWGTVPFIIRNGYSWFSSIGTENSKGTMIFALVGKINNTGLVEVPMGITLREIIFDIGGGIPGGKKFKAVQTGGPSGGCLPESCLDLPVDYDSLKKAGSMMGSGGMIVMDEDTCMVQVAKYFLAFTQDESCGKCVPCRDGVRIMLGILDRITEGNGREGDIGLLEELGKRVSETSLCALGGSAANPVLSTIRYFRDEYEKHIAEKKCPAGACRELIRYEITDNCNGCHACFKKCPEKAISGEAKKQHVIDQSKCTKCGICFETCRFGAIKKA